MAERLPRQEAPTQPRKDPSEKPKTITLLSWEEILDRITDLEARLDKKEADDELTALGWDTEKKDIERRPWG